MEYEYEVTCPHCNTTFYGTPNGCSLHCWDWKLSNGKYLYGSIEDNMVQCPDCLEFFDFVKEGNFKNLNEDKTDN